MNGLGPGQLRHRLVLQAPSETADGAGGVTRGFATIGSVWAELEPTAAETGLAGDAPANLVAYRATLRWRADITTGHRLAKGARLFAIRGLLDPDGRRRRLRLTLEEITA